MKIQFLAAMAAGALALSFAGQASAVQVFGTGSAIVNGDGTHLSYEVRNNGSQTGDLTLLTFPGSFDVYYTGTDDLTTPGGSANAFAQVQGTGSGNGVGFEDVTIDPGAPFLGMSAIKFNISRNRQSTPNSNDVTFRTQLNYLGGNFELLGPTSFAGDSRYLVTAATGLIIESITLFDVSPTNYNIGSIKQVSFDGVFPDVVVPGGIPEPAAWALMIMGFGGVGAMMRRRRMAFSAI
jgi:hypothetical protein